jgi:hypothetical protein
MVGTEIWFVISLDFLFLLMHREFAVLEWVYTLLNIHVFIRYRLLAIGLSATTNDTKWSIYWIIYMLFNFLEYFHYDFYQNLRFYWLGKFILLIWFMIPGSLSGTNLVYYQIIRRFILSYVPVSWFLSCFSLHISRIYSLIVYLFYWY